MKPPPHPGKNPIPALMVAMFEDQKVSLVLLGATPGSSLRFVVPNHPESNAAKTLPNRILRKLISEDYQLEPRDERFPDRMAVRFSRWNDKAIDHSEVSFRWSRQEFEIFFASEWDP